MEKTRLSESDVCAKYITPALHRAGWDETTQIRREVSFTKGRIIVRGKLVSRGRAKRADYVLYHKPNFPIALIEAKDNTHAVGDGMQQALDYAETLHILAQGIWSISYPFLRILPLSNVVIQGLRTDLVQRICSRYTQHLIFLEVLKCIQIVQLR